MLWFFISSDHFVAMKETRKQNRANPFPPIPLAPLICCISCVTFPQGAFKQSSCGQDKKSAVLFAQTFKRSFMGYVTQWQHLLAQACFLLTHWCWQWYVNDICVCTSRLPSIQRRELCGNFLYSNIKSVYWPGMTCGIMKLWLTVYKVVVSHLSCFVECLGQLHHLQTPTLTGSPFPFF